VHERLIYRNQGNRALLAMLPGPPGRLLDCGCGAGDNARLLEALGWRVTGITIDAREREAALPFCDEVLLADLELGLSDDVPEGFDVVLMSHILEHLAHPGRLLADVRRRLRAGGVAAVALPNVLNYRQRLRFLRGNFTYQDDGIMDRTHLRFYTYTTAQELLEEHGFQIVQGVPDGGLPWWKLRRLVPEASRLPIDRWASRRTPNLLAGQCLFLARPVPTVRSGA
jgi:2-polyprenyl-3-methyl-5-hydroxy-6-metoxy-1,4-benzoquinol methylase